MRSARCVPGRAWRCSLPSAPAPARREVAVLKSSEVPAWRPALDALRRAASAHTLTEYDLRGDRAEAERVRRRAQGQGGDPGGHGAPGRPGRRATPARAPPRLLHGPGPGAAWASRPPPPGVAFPTPIKNQLAAFRLVNPRGVRIGVIYSDAGGGQARRGGAEGRAPWCASPSWPGPWPPTRTCPPTLRALLKGDDAVDALWIPPDPLLLGDETRRFLLAETLKAGKPVYSFSSALVAEGALVSNGPDLARVGEQAGELVNRLAAATHRARDPARPARGARDQQEDRGQAEDRDPGRRPARPRSKVF